MMKTLYDSKLWMEDLREGVAAAREDLKALEGRTVLVTGAGGLICSALVDLLICYNEMLCTEEAVGDIPGNRSIRILAAGRSEGRMRARFGVYSERPYFHFVPYDATSDEVQVDTPADYIVHGASNAYPGIFTKEPVETMAANFSGLKALLDYAVYAGTRRVLYVSSSEVYGRRREGDAVRPFSENDYGYVDLLSPRSCYPISKRAAETLCVSYSEEYGVETVIVRPGFIYGPTASAKDNRISSVWAYLAARGEEIVMLSEGLQQRNYTYCTDCAAAILAVLLRGENRRAYNIASDRTQRICDIAEMLAQIGGVRLVRKGAGEQERKAFNPMENSALDGSALAKLGWTEQFEAVRGLGHTVEILRDIGNDREAKQDN